MLVIDVLEVKKPVLYRNECFVLQPDLAASQTSVASTYAYRGGEGDERASGRYKMASSVGLSQNPTEGSDSWLNIPLAS